MSNLIICTSDGRRFFSGQVSLKEGVSETDAKAIRDCRGGCHHGDADQTWRLPPSRIALRITRGRIEWVERCEVRSRPLPLLKVEDLILDKARRGSSAGLLR